MSVVQLHKAKPADDVVSTLRRIADEIEAGEIAWPVTTAVLCLGHTDGEIPVEEGVLIQRNFWTTYGFGPRCDSFTCRGLLSTVLQKWNHDD